MDSQQPEPQGVSPSGAPTTLTRPQQEQLDKDKVRMHMQNERYLRAHPELKHLIGTFVQQTLEYKPDNLLEFAGRFFTRSDLYAMVKVKSKELIQA
ncbi:unnamed protein product [Vitrella brassicaformis CCMP3155]|uniref:RIIa domain-containing protein n=1 Tax=Vitrella brassicaformis (strain CCMP3155) TaxID=1169540 RepID=A0A0G4FXE9_VITBC|nr:unnamed protein product [Vitrella brassicaformis CCMP3155]|eukprot:CEM20089.1 unnamed protein product [Vitrella brassicaformis CCMP3155]